MFECVAALLIADGDEGVAAVVNGGSGRIGQRGRIDVAAVQGHEGQGENHRPQYECGIIGHGYASPVGVTALLPCALRTHGAGLFPRVSIDGERLIKAEAGRNSMGNVQMGACDLCRSPRMTRPKATPAYWRRESQLLRTEPTSVGSCRGNVTNASSQSVALQKRRGRSRRW